MALRVLLVHQSFPSQLIAVLEALERRDDVELAGIGMNAYARKGLRYRQYSPVPVAQTGDIVIDDLASKATLAAGAAAAARALSYDGFVPDIIVAHPGWGEALYLKDLFPRAKLVCYCEYYYLRSGGEVNFDPEFPPAPPEVLHRMRARNAITLASLEDADVCVAPTPWQKSTFPAMLHAKIEVFHEGVEVPPAENRGTDRAASGGPSVSFVARHLEPHRGFHTFMRALPRLLRADPSIQVSVIGSDRGGYGAPPSDGRTWKSVLLEELDSSIDEARVRFLGSIDRRRYLDVLRHSDVHVYLTYPFVLSWSALETMGAGKAMVVSDTAPVRDYFADECAAVVDFFDPRALATRVSSLLRNSKTRASLGRRAGEAFHDHQLARHHGRAAWERLLMSV
ncbi:glycosyltransferase [Methylobacterium oxalidis]|uniref:Glycosyl transferase family 1 n=1 Tax=Methylobacterium oxalidis TaxID=944322 RepID=A0A512IX90_9HYPH|nr:glycosyltransferase [Methylobacterium oxalidis]GEP02296.1 glycosyl transferase family 1 [Methylobacterium oxalidis]GJE31196.1 hypothetical protein LDDCCGHA_1372 [Methylobacterium oxalidis]GLS67675.1 glycosyl transferase family 1 [Methylobacterium oxalidis]